MNEQERLRDNEQKGIADLFKDAGFVIFATVGWLGYIPFCLAVVLVMGLMFYMLAPFLGMFVGWMGVEVSVIFAKAFVCAYAIVLMGLNALGARINIDAKSLNPAKLPSLMIGSIFKLAKPNRFTLYFSVPVILVLIHDFVLK